MHCSPHSDEQAVIHWIDDHLQRAIYYNLIIAANKRKTMAF